MLHGKQPWYRASRNAQGMSLFSDQKAAASVRETPWPQVPNHGDVFFGYSRMGAAHCQAAFSGAAKVCSPFSASTSNLSGWNASVEKKYLHYFGAVADFGRQYGGVSQSSFLFGLRGSTTMGRFRPFAEALFGAVHTLGNGAVASKSDTSFAAALGGGIDLRLTRLLCWRIQADDIKTSLAAVEQHSVRLSSGMAVRF